MTKREVTQKNIAGELDITESGIRYSRAIGKELYEIVEFRIPTYIFQFKQEQMILLKCAPEQETRALVVAIRMNKCGFVDVRCYVKGGYNALGR